MTTGIATLDTTIQKTREWIKDVMAELRTDDPEKAYAALHTTLGALRDRLTVDEAAHLSAQLPMLIRGIYYEGYDPSDLPSKERRREEFFAQMENALGARDDLNPEDASRAVFAVLAKRVSEGEIQDVVAMLPRDLRELWPSDSGR